MDTVTHAAMELCVAYPRLKALVQKKGVPAENRPARTPFSLFSVTAPI